MRLPEAPVIPDVALDLAWQDDQLLRDAHGRLASMTLSKFMAELPGVQRPEEVELTSFVDLQPSDYDSRRAIAWLGPYTHSWDAEHAPGVVLLQDSLEVPTRVIYFPSGPYDKRTDTQGEQDIKGGDFRPLARPQIRTLHALGIETVTVVGGSEGATIGAALAAEAPKSGLIEVDRAVLIEPPNVAERTNKEITADFKGKGLDGWREMNRGINDSAVPLLSEAQHSRGGLDYLYQLVGFAGFARRSKSDINQIIMDGFCQPTFNGDLTDALRCDPNLFSYLASGRLSRVAPVDVMRRIISGHNEAFPGRIYGRVVEGYGHELIENLVVKALVVKEGVEGYFSTPS